MTNIKLEIYFDYARQVAFKSPCVRRQYGAVILRPDIGWVGGNNARTGNCCNGVCVRNRFDFPHGGSIEAGGEVHAETAALINLNRNWDIPEPYYFLLVGFDTQTKKELLGTSVYPCHMCAMNIKYAGFNEIYIRDSDYSIKSIDIDDIIKYREEVWQQTS